MSRFQRAVPVLQVGDVERSITLMRSVSNPIRFLRNRPTALLSLGVTTQKSCFSALTRRRHFTAATVGPYICEHPVRISWSSQRLSGGLPHSFEGLSVCSMASWSLRLSTWMVTAFA
jgi:hypothetical protein